MEMPKAARLHKEPIIFYIGGEGGSRGRGGDGLDEGPLFSPTQTVVGGPPFFQRPQNVEGGTGPSLGDQDDLPYIIPLKIHVFGEEGVY